MGICQSPNERHYSRGMEIRDARIEDWPRIWPFFREIVRAGDTFAYDQRMEEPEARAIWMVGPPARTAVAVDAEDVLGTASMYANRPGPGSHVASASYMVNPAHWGKGTGRALVEDSLDWARRAGFKAIQFNAVTETNTSAVALYRSLGFEVIGTVPEAFLHPTEGYVGLHVMHRRL
jgi:L-amino acid N-acyltransferase YncA